MDTLQQAFKKEVMKQFAYPVVLAKIIKRQLEKKGVVLTRKQVSKLEKQFRKNIRKDNGDKLNFDIDLDDEQNKILGISDGDTVEFDDPSQMLDEIYQEFITNVEKSVPEVVNKVTVPISSHLRKTAPEMLKEHKKLKKGFEDRLYNDWKKPFDMFETFLVIASEAGDELNNEFRKDEANKKNYVLEVLTRLHARACQIAYEILTLLKSGYADGAHARWRSLHEIAVVSSFIKKHGNETAERYLLHHKIESFKDAELYQKHYEALGYTPMSQGDYASIEAEYEKLITRFGKPYKSDYGWASLALNNHKKPTFLDIEEDSELDHFRPYYRLANHNVHAGSKGAVFRLGLLQNAQNILLAGPSNVGFTDPAQNAVISLGIITITLITSIPTIDNLVTSNILLERASEIGEEFLKIQEEIEDREATYQSTLHKQEES